MSTRQGFGVIDSHGVILPERPGCRLNRPLGFQKLRDPDVRRDGAQGESQLVFPAETVRGEAHQFQQVVESPRGDNHQSVCGWDHGRYATRLAGGAQTPRKP